MRFITLIISSLLIIQCSSSMRSKDAAITANELNEHLSFLASDKMEGRKPGSSQSQIAAQYIADHFRQLGLDLLGEDGFQNFDIVTSVSLGKGNHFISGAISGTPGQDYTPTAFSASTSLDGEVVFAGYGFQIENDSIQWNDYGDVDVKGKWVMILRGTPESEGAGDRYAAHSTLRHKVLMARDNGASGVIFISGEKFDKDDDLMSLHMERNFSLDALPIIHVKRSLADQLLQTTGKTISDLELQFEKQPAASSFSAGVTLSVATEIIQHTASAQNVIGMLKGSDPVLAHEFIVVGAHYDHLGWGGPGSGSRKPDTKAIHNGADDNASGVSAVLEIAERFSLEKSRPKRSIVFVAFAAEEMGLLGSKFFTSSPLIEIKNVKQMFNLDMVGRLDPQSKALTVGGTGTAKGMEEFLSSMKEESGLILSMTPDGYGPSDHASFYVENIPVLFFFTGITEEYHTPDDDVETINFEGEKLIADFAYDLIREIASMDQTMAFQEAGPKGPPQGGKSGKVKMGIIPDFAAANSQGFLLGGVVPGGPAAFAGMQKGDVMISMEGRSIKNVYDYMGRMSEVKLGQRITVEVLRGDQKLILIVQL
ncbi:MAG: M20/M25/M40 family metallo-hydrolase [Candidatus Marinimicrobia bacterium]|nr:M20/M25/M40 family metallo-hydrolase [Candidatus Neomarinimicrobiota bacterium]